MGNTVLKRLGEFDRNCGKPMHAKYRDCIKTFRVPTALRLCEKNSDGLGWAHSSRRLPSIRESLIWKYQWVFRIENAIFSVETKPSNSSEFALVNHYLHIFPSGFFGNCNWNVRVCVWILHFFTFAHTNRGIKRNYVKTKWKQYRFETDGKKHSDDTQSVSSYT